jgi:hypothetical protein
VLTWLVPRKRAARHRGRVKAFPKVCRVLLKCRMWKRRWDYEAYSEGLREKDDIGGRREREGRRRKKNNNRARTTLTTRMTPRSPSISPPVWVTRPV